MPFTSWPYHPACSVTALHSGQRGLVIDKEQPNSPPPCLSCQQGLENCFLLSTYLNLNFPSRSNFVLLSHFLKQALLSHSQLPTLIKTVLLSWYLVGDLSSHCFRPLLPCNCLERCSKPLLPLHSALPSVTCETGRRKPPSPSLHRNRDLGGGWSWLEDQI